VEQFSETDNGWRTNFAALASVLFEFLQNLYRFDILFKYFLNNSLN